MKTVLNHPKLGLLSPKDVLDMAAKHCSLGISHTLTVAHRAALRFLGLHAVDLGMAHQTVAVLFVVVGRIGPYPAGCVVGS